MHYAGNLQIAASVFITLSLLLVVFLIAHFLATQNHADAEATTETTALPDNDNAEHKHRSRTHYKKYHLLRSHIYKTTILFLITGASLQFLAQFFGILGLTVVATGPLGELNGGNYGAGTWSIDLALARYGSVAWLTALIAAGTLRFGYRSKYFGREY